MGKFFRLLYVIIFLISLFLMSPFREVQADVLAQADYNANIDKAFSPAIIQRNGIVRLTVTISNPNAFDLINVAWTDNFPIGLTIASSPNMTSDCGIEVTATAGDNKLVLVNGFVAASGSCSVAVDVAAGQSGDLINTIGPGELTAGDGSGGTVSNTVPAADTLKVYDYTANLTKAFTPSLIGRNEVSRLSIMISNPNAFVLTNAAWTDNFPAGLTIASIPNMTSDCGGSVTAVAGGGTLSLTRGTVAANGACTIAVDVAASQPETLTTLVNTIDAGVLTANGNGGLVNNIDPATDTLSIAAYDYSAKLIKSFLPAYVAQGATSTLSVTISNPNSFSLTNAGWTDTLPTGLAIASSPNPVTTDCGIGATVNANAGDGAFSFSGGTVPAKDVTGNGLCTVSVDVVANQTGNLTNTIGANALTATGNGGSVSNPDLASAVLNVATFNFSAEINKSFSPDIINPGDTSTLSITVYNPNTFQLTNAAWTDYLDSIQPGIKIASTPNIVNGCSGTVTAIAGGTSVSLSDGVVPAQVGGINGQCTVSVDVTSTTQGNLTNTIPSGALTSDGPGGLKIGNTDPASRTLRVIPISAPSVTKSFSPNTVWVEQTSRMTINIRNNDAGNSITETSLTDVLPLNVVLAAIVSETHTNCGPSVSVTADPGTDIITINNAAIAANATCSVAVNVKSAISDAYTNHIDAGAVHTKQGVTNASPAEADLNVQAVGITKSFLPGTFQAGDTSVLTITLENRDTLKDYTNVYLSDVLPGALQAVPGSATTTCVNDLGDQTVDLSGSPLKTIELNNGKISKAVDFSTPTTCTITVTVTTPSGAVVSDTTYTNTIAKNIMTTQEGITNLVSASANVTVTPITIDVFKSFSPNRFQAGGQSTLTITLRNDTNKSFTEVGLVDTMPVGLLITGTPSTNCVNGSVSFTNPPPDTTSQITLSGVSLASGTSCTVTAQVTVDPAATTQNFNNTISANTVTSFDGVTNLTGTSGSVDIYTTGEGVTGNKSFNPSVTLAGVQSQLTINLYAPADQTLHNFSVTDTLPPGLVIFSTPNVTTSSGCNAAATATPGDNKVSLSGGTINAGGLCRIQVYVTGNAPATYTNTLHPVDISNTELQTLGQAITADLRVTNLKMRKVFYPATVSPNGFSTLTITLENTNDAQLINVDLTDSLNTMGDSVNGVIVAPLPNESTTCGGSITFPDSKTIRMTGGTIPAKVGSVNGICTILVDVQGKRNVTTPPSVTFTNNIPVTNVSGKVDILNGPTIQPELPATAPLTITDLVLGVIKGFDPLTVFGGTLSTLSVTLDNTNNTVLTGLAFTDTLPAGMYIGNPVDPSTGTCGGTLTALPGGTQFSYSGGVLNANKRCTITLNATMNVNGNRTNTIPALGVTSFNGASNLQPASATLTNLPGASITKFFMPGTIVLGETSELTIRIKNTGNIPLTQIGLVDNLPAGLTITASPVPSTTCDNVSTPVLTAAAGTGRIEIANGSLAAGPNTTCDIKVTVTAASANNYTNTIDARTLVTFEDATNPDPATDTLTVNSAPDLQLVKTGILDMTQIAPPESAEAGDQINYTLVATNMGDVTLTNVTITDADPDVVIGTCTPAQPATLLSGETLSCPAVYTLKAGDISASLFTNTATVTSKLPDGTTDGPTDSDSENIPLNEPFALGIKKIVTNTGPFRLDDTINYSITVTNLGLNSLTDVRVTDPGLDVTLGICSPVQGSTLASGEQMICSATHKVVSADVNAGHYNNTAIADSVETSPVSDTATVPVKQNARLELFKEVISNGPYSVGSTITYDISAKNTGDLTLNNVSISDLPSVPSDPDYTVTLGACTPSQPAVLQPGEILSCTASHVVTDANMTAGGFSNTAEATSTEAGPVTDTATVILKIPSIHLIKTGTLVDANLNGRADAGEEISYAFTVTNTGEVTLTDIILTDIVGGITITGGPIPTLAPGAVDNSTFTGSYTLTQADIDNNEFTNTAIVTGFPPVGSPVSAPAVDIQSALAEPSLELVKTITSGENYNQAGAVIFYSYTLRNIGNVNLTGNGAGNLFTITDDRINGGAPFTCGAATSLAIGGVETVTCTNSYIVTQADLDSADTVINHANGHGKFGTQDVVSNEATATATETPTWNATLAKTLETTEFNVAGNDHTQAVIGEVLTYKLIASFPSGTTVSANLVDNLDAGLALVDVDSVTVSNPDTDGEFGNADTGLNSSRMTFDAGSGLCTNCTAGTNGVTSNPFVENSGGKLTFDFGKVINTNTVNETVTIFYRVIVLNDIGNQNTGATGTTGLNNSAALSWAGAQTTASAANVRVVEPTLTLTKLLDVTGHDAGDTITFNITVSNGNAASDTVAYDAALSDVIPTGLTYVTGSAAQSPASNCTDNSVAPVFAYDGPSRTLSAAWDTFPKNSSCTFTFDATLDADVLPGQTIAANTAELRWTSISGVRSNLSAYNTSSDERTGPTGGIGSDTLNNYGVASSTSAITLDNVTGQKSIIASSEAHTTYPNVAVGEIVRYRLVMQLPESMVTDLQFSDTFAGTGGQRFLNDGTARVLFVANGGVSSADYIAGGVPAISSCTNYTGTFTLAQAADPLTIPSADINCALADANITNTENSNSDTYPTNGGVHFQLGTITNGDNDVDPEFIIIEFNTLVTNEAVNINGRSLTDSFIGRRWNGTAMVNMGSASPAVSLSVREPDLTVSKVLIAPNPLDAGDTVTYELTITANGTTSDHATGYELILTDTLDAGLEPTSEVIASTQTSPCVGNGSGTTAFTDGISRTGQVVTLTASCLDPGQSITATITAKVAQGATAGSTIPNTAALTYTSLPGDYGTVSNPTQSSVVGAPGTATGERTGSGTAPNTYTSSASVSFTLNAPTLVKVDPTPTSYTIGDTVSYDIRVTLPEGVTPSLVVTDNIPSGVKPTGSLPYGLKYVSSQVLTVDAALTADFSGPTDVTLISGVCGGTCATGDDVTFTFNDVTTLNDNNVNNNTFIIRIVLLVENVRGNQDRIPANVEYPTSLINSATAVYTGGSTNDSAAAITVVEPRITTTKSVSPTTNVKAGDTLNYTVRFTNTGNSTAYDVTVLDVMAQGVTFGSVTSCNYFNGTVTNSIGYTTSVTTVLGLDNVTIDGSPAGIGAWDIPATAPDSYIECVYTGVVQNNLILNGNHTNAVDADWTSQDGVQANERNYADGITYNFDGTQDRATATFTTGLVTLSKSDGGFTQGTIGDSITYTITVGGANVLGTLRSLVVTDTLPAGLIYDGNVVFSGFSTSPVPTVSTNDGSAPVTVSFNFGDTIKSVDNATITFNAHIADVIGNARTVAKSNSVSATYLNVAGTTVNLGPATDGFTIIEPVITTTKSVSPTTNVMSGDTLNYTVRFTNTGDSTAYDVTALDTLAQGVNFGSVTGCNYFDGSTTAAIPYTAVTGAGNVTFDGSPSGVGAWDIPATATDSYIECVYTGVAQSTLYLDGAHVNTVDADWTSQNGAGTLGERVYDDSVSRVNVDGTQDTATATFSSGAPTITKDDGGVTQTVIGQVISFTLTVNSPLGTLQNARVVDSLPAGFIYVANSQSVDAGVGAATFSSTVPVDGSASGTLTWDFGNAVVTNSPFTIRYDAIVANVAGNQNYTVLTNTATLSYTNVGGSTQSVSSNATSTITEPVLTIGKIAASGSATPDVGDEVTYTITIAHDTDGTLPDSTATAYDVNFTDLLPVYADLQIGTVAVSGTGAATVTDTSSDATNTVGISISDIAIGTTATITYKAILTSALVPSQAIVNTGYIYWSSQSGDNKPGDVDGERDGSGSVNDYSNNDTATLYAADLGPVKSIVSTSESHTAETGDGSDSSTNARALAIGEILRYRMEVTVPEGTSTNLTFADTLPAGLSYLGNPKVSIISNSLMTVPADLAGARNGDLPPTFDLPVGRITLNSQDVTFSLGDLTNHDSDLDVERVVVDFNVLVNNDANNGNSTIHDNQFTASISGGTPVQSNHVFSKVVEPVLLLAKTANALTNWSYNETVTYTLNITTDASSAADTFNLRVADRIPDGLTYVNSPASITAPAGWVADDSGAPDLVWTCDSACYLPLGGSAVFTYQVTVDAPPLASALTGNDTVTNNALLTFTSLPGDKGTVSNITGSSTPGNSGDANGERNGSSVGVNTYNDPAEHTGGIAPYYSIGNRVWFDTDNSGTMNGSEVGVGGVLVQLYAASDTNFDTVLASDTTTAAGFYLFDYLVPGDYVVVVAASNFTGAGELVGYWSSGTSLDDLGVISENVIDVDVVATDADDNGKRQTADPIIGAVVTLPITLGGTEPTDEIATQLESGVLGDQGAQPDERANMTVDFGFYRTEIGGLLWMEGGTVVDGEYVLADDSLMTNNIVRLYAANGSLEIPVGSDGIWGTVGDGPGGMLTGAGGDYKFSGLPDGNYVVKVSETIGMISTLDAFDQADNDDPNTNTDSNDNGDNHQEAAGVVASNLVDSAPGSTGSKNNNTVTDLTGTTTNLTIDFGFAGRYAVGNRVWFDTDNSGTLNGGESGVGGVTVQLFAAGSLGEPTGPALDTVVTNSQGYYLFDNLFPDDYVIVIPSSNFSGLGKLTGYWSSLTLMTSAGSTTETSPNDPDDDAQLDDNGMLAGSDVISMPITLGPIGGTEPVVEGDVDSTDGQGSQPDDHANMTLDFGFFRPATVGDFVWNDTNYNGIQDAGETGVDAVTVDLYTDADLFMGTTTTDASGIYRFTNLVAGNYYVIFTLPNGYVFSPKNADPDTAKDSDADPVTGQSATVTLADGETNNTVDAGMYVAAPALSLVKTAAPLTYDAVGDVISYSYLVTNSGNITLYAPFTITDDKSIDESCPATPVSLARGETITCTASYTITQPDLDNGSVTNIASVSDGTVTSPTDTETVTAVQNPLMTVVKSSTSTSLNAPGTVQYSYLVTNIGNVTLTGISLSDDNDNNDMNCPTTTLAPTTTMTCSATHTFTQAELDANGSPTAASGNLTNNVTASSNEALDAVDTLDIPITQSPSLSIVKTALPTTYNAVGNVINYSYLVTNTGNITLAGPFTVSDDKAADESCLSTATLSPGGTITCTASYTITQSDLDNGSVTNIASASNGTVTSPTDSETVTAVQNPLMTVVKSSTSTSLNAPGTVAYSYLVANIGNVTLTGISLSDDNDNNDMNCPATILAPTATMTCSATHTFTQAELNANGSPMAASGNLTNNVTASSNEAPDAVDTLDIPITQSPFLSIVKTALPTTYDAVGDVINYNYLVTNNGNVTLTGPFTVSDNKATDESCPVTAALLPGGTITCTASYTITQPDLDNGSITNIASVSNGTVTSPTDSETVTAVQGPSLSIVKTAFPTTYDAVGDVISYSYLVTNTGNVTLAGPFTVSDDKATDESCPSTAALLPGGTITCTASYTITQSDLDNGSVTNIASVSNGTVTSPTDSETVTAAQSPSLSIVKTALPTTYNAVGNVINYSYLVTNTGNITLAGPFTVSDDKAADESCPVTATLSPGGTITCTASYTITQSDLDNGSVTNIASASNGTVTSPTDSETVTAAQGPSLSIVKTALPITYNAVGNVINYSYLVTNTGNVTLAGPFTVSDDKSIDESCPVTATLLPGGTITCTASYTITQSDLDNGSVTNIASVSNGTVTSPTDSEIVIAVQNPLMTVEKSSTSTSLSAPGTVAYSYLVTNIGNVTLTGISLSDDNDNDDMNCPATTLTPTATMTCTATHTLTQVELDAGGTLDNIVTASSNEAPNVTDNLSIPITQHAVLMIEKSSASTSLSVPGTVAYSYLVMNIGNVTLTGISLSDDNDNNDMNCPATTLAPAATMTCSATHTFTQAELDANGSPMAASGNLTNNVTVSSNEALDVTDTLSIPITQSPSLSIVKTALPTTYDAVGDVINYSYLVTNSGNITLAGPFTVSDDKATDESCPVTATLSPGGTITCTASYTITQSDLDTGSVTNIASVSNGTVTSPTDSETVTAVQGPSLSIVKTAFPTTYDAVGDVINYNYLVTNNGNITIAGPFTVNDDKATDESCPATAVLLPGGTITCTASYTITQFDLNNGSVTNIASVSNGTVTSPTDSETVTAIQIPGVSIVKTPSATVTNSGGSVTYSYVVTNLGNIPLASIVVTDDKCSPVSFVNGDANANNILETTERWNYTCTSILTTTTTNIATVSGSYGTIQVQDTDTATVNVVSTDFSKIITGTSETFTSGDNVAIGEIVTYQITMNLSSNMTLGNVVVTDRMDKGLAFVDCVSVNLAGVNITSTVCPPTVSAITDSGDQTTNPANPGRRVQFDIGDVTAPAVASTLVIQYNAIVLDVIENQETDTLNNSATITWTGGSLTTSAQNVVIIEPDLAIDKSATPDAVDVGAFIEFTLVVSHTEHSSADAFDVVVTDVLPDGLIYVACTPIEYSGLVPTRQPDPCNIPSGNELTFTWDAFPLNQSATIVFYARFDGTQPSLVNLASVEWTSLSIDPGQGDLPVQLSTYNAVSTERWYDPLDTINIYQVTDSVSINALPKVLPDTGFAPNVITILPEQPAERSYMATDVWLEIPSLGVNIPIVGVPMVGSDWDVSWLWKEAGWLNGTAFPGWKGNSALTGHVTLSNGNPGPFAGLGRLKWGDKILVHSYGSVYTYEVRENRTVTPRNTSVLKHEEEAWLTLITCKSYSERTETYSSRVAVRAVLVKIELEK